MLIFATGSLLITLRIVRSDCNRHVSSTALLMTECAWDDLSTAARILFMAPK